MTKKPAVAIYGLWPDLRAYTRQKLRKFLVTIHPDIIKLDELGPRTDFLAVFIESPVTKQVMAKLPHLKGVASMSTGYDHIDLVEAKKRKIPVSNVPSYGENTVAEHTFALMLALTRRLFDSAKRVKEGRYDFGGLRGVDLKGRTLGVIGTGHIGAHVIRIAKGFEMNVLAYDVRPKADLAKTLGFSYVTLPKLLKQSDIVTLHTPLFKENYHLLNKKTIALMKKGSYLINTARGALVEPAAVLGALNSGRLAGAGLDVLEDEKLLQNFEEVMHCKNNNCKLQTSLINNLLIDHPNTIITPHNAFNSTEALKRIIDVTAQNLEGFAAGHPINLVR